MDQGNRRSSDRIAETATKPVNIGLAVRQRRQELGLRLADVAKLIGISESQLSRLERGQSRPQVLILRRLDQVLRPVAPLRPEAGDPSEAITAEDAARRVGSLWPFVGRELELAAIAAAIASRRQAAVVLAGTQGVGKTRLAREALTVAQSRRHSTLMASGLQAATAIPFGAFAGILAVPGRAVHNRHALLRDATRSLTERANGRRVVLGVDDAHLLDDVSATFVHHLATSGSAFVVATVTSGQAAPDPIIALWKDGFAERLEVPPLDSSAIMELLRSVLGGYVETRTQHLLWEACRGHVLLLHEIVLAGVETGALLKTDGVWRWRGQPVSGLRLGEVTQSRIGKLVPEEKELVELLAVGQPLELRVVERLAAEPVIERLETAGLIRVEAAEGSHMVRLAHPLYADILGRQLPIRLRKIKRQLATAVEAAGSADADDLLRVATWRLEADDDVAPASLISSSQRAGSLSAHGLAEQLARAALAAEDSFDGRLLLGQALAGQLRFLEAEEVMAAADALANTDAERGSLALARANNLMWGLIQSQDAVAVLEQAERVVNDPAWQDQLRALRAYVLVWSGHVKEALTLADTVIQKRGVRDRPYVQALVAASAGWLNSGRLDDVLRHADRGIEAARLLSDELPLSEAQMRGAKWWALLGTGQVKAAGKLAESSYKRAVDARLYDAAAYLTVPYGYSAMTLGLVRTATQRFAEAMPLLREHDSLGDLRLAHAMNAQAAALAGDALLAEAEIALAAADDRPTARLILSEVFLRSARAWLAASQRDIERAREHAREAVEMAQIVGAIGLEMLTLNDLVRLGAASAAVDRLAELSGIVPGPLINANTRRARALVDEDPHTLEEVAGTFESMGSLLLAAETATDAASANDRAGEPGRARIWRHKASLLLSRCEGAWTPAVGPLAAVLPDPLTPREREVAELAARGLVSRLIAERLGVSIRTVDNHLARVYDKLGVDSRNDLRELIARSPQTH
jgi:DNA-binding CsgD family transcriptional regulator/transcriptional regulator with XRE-family HTH domain